MKQLNAAKLLALVGGKALIIPREGWNAHNFRIHGYAMIRTMHRTALITQKRQAAEVARASAQAFGRQIDETIARFLATPNFSRRSGKIMGSVFLQSHEALVMDILNDVLEKTGPNVIAQIAPAIQSTIGQGYAKTSVLLAQKPFIAGNTNLHRRALELARRVTSISETTRTRLRNVLKQALKQNLSVADTARLIRTKMPKIQGARALTIARTEMNKAWTSGAIQAFKESKTLTQVSVIGCESREEDQWDKPSYAPYLYRGESTCNIEGVPVSDADKLDFHVNHTGTIIPSGFTE